MLQTILKLFVCMEGIYEGRVTKGTYIVEENVVKGRECEVLSVE